MSEFSLNFLFIIMVNPHNIILLKLQIIRILQVIKLPLIAWNVMFKKLSEIIATCTI